MRLFYTVHHHYSFPHTALSASKHTSYSLPGLQMQTCTWSVLCLALVMACCCHSNTRTVSLYIYKSVCNVLYIFLNKTNERTKTRNVLIFFLSAILQHWGLSGLAPLLSFLMANPCNLRVAQMISWIMVTHWPMSFICWNTTHTSNPQTATRVPHSCTKCVVLDKCTIRAFPRTIGNFPKHRRCLGKLPSLFWKQKNIYVLV